VITAFQTISAPSSGHLRERGSRFLSFAFRVENETEIRAHLDRLRKEYFDATHHCFAWRLGADGSHYRANDDGEPGHSAGDSILGQLRSRNLTDVLVVVVRYYGGTNLGVGGLVKAYRGATALALDATTIIEVQVKLRWKLGCRYHELSELMKIAKTPGNELVSSTIGEHCSVVVEAPAGFDLAARAESLSLRGIGLTCERLDDDSA